MWEKEQEEEEELGGRQAGGKLSEESIHLGLKSSSCQRVFYHPPSSKISPFFSRQSFKPGENHENHKQLF